METTSKYTVLMLEDDITFLTISTKALRREFSDAEILTARSVAEAQLLISEYLVNFFILDVQLPDGSGIDFLLEAKTLMPEAEVVVNTATPLPEYHTRARNLGAVQFFEKPVPPRVLCDLVRAHKESLQQGSSGEGTYSGSLTSLKALDIIQLKCLGGATTAVAFIVGRDLGRVYFEAGQIVHAETGTVGGTEALRQILSWPGGQLHETAGARPEQRTIEGDWQGVLLQVVQEVDEQGSSPQVAP